MFTSTYYVFCIMYRQRMMLKEKLFWFPLFLQVNTKCFLAEVEGLGKEMQTIPTQTLPLLVESKLNQTSPSLVRNEDEMDILIGDESDDFGTNDRKRKKVDKGAEYGSDYNDYGSMFFGGNYFLCVNFQTQVQIPWKTGSKVKPKALLMSSI